MVKVSIARENSEFNQNQSDEYYDYIKYKITYGDIEKYRIYKRVARGKYSEVFEGKKIENNTIEPCIIKVLKPVKIAKINREIKILRTLEHPNIIPLLDVVVDSDSMTHSLLFMYLNHKNTTALLKEIIVSDLQIYCRQALEALKYCHSRGIMHRDIKPQNLLINPETKELKIIDWGLAEFYHPGTEYQVKVATRYYKGPELLLDYPYYDYSLDIWSLGCVIAEVLFEQTPFFCGSDNIDQLHKIVQVLGIHDLMDYAEEYEIEINPEIAKNLPENKKMHWDDFIIEGKDTAICYKAIDFLDKVLLYDHKKRLTAKECLEHPFLKE